MASSWSCGGEREDLLAQEDGIEEIACPRHQIALGHRKLQQPV